MANQALPNVPWSIRRLLESAVTHTASYVSNDFFVDRFTSIIVFIKTTNIGGTSPTLNAYLQKEMPNGDWADIGAFTQITTNTSRVLEVVSGGKKEYSLTDGSLAAGTVLDVTLGRRNRIKIVIGGTNPTVKVTLGFDLLQ